MMTILRKFTTLFLCLTLSVTTIGCGGNNQAVRQNRSTPQQSTAPTKIADGKYPVQQASYSDANGEYELFLLNTSKVDLSLWSRTSTIIAF